MKKSRIFHVLEFFIEGAVWAQVILGKIGPIYQIRVVKASRIILNREILAVIIIYSFYSPIGSDCGSVLTTSVVVRGILFGSWYPPFSEKPESFRSKE